MFAVSFVSKGPNCLHSLTTKNSGFQDRGVERKIEPVDEVTVQSKFKVRTCVCACKKIARQDITIVRNSEQMVGYWYYICQTDIFVVI